MNPTPSPYLLPAVSNGNAQEQALIRRHWKESLSGTGTLVWEYALGGLYADAILFLGLQPDGSEFPGQKSAAKYPLSGATVILLEAKATLCPELIGQALVYRELILSRGATITGSMLMAASDPHALCDLSRSFGLIPVIARL